MFAINSTWRVESVISRLDPIEQVYLIVHLHSWFVSNKRDLQVVRNGKTYGPISQMKLK